MSKRITKLAERCRAASVGNELPHFLIDQVKPDVAYYKVQGQVVKGQGHIMKTVCHVVFQAIVANKLLHA